MAKANVYVMIVSGEKLSKRLNRCEKASGERKTKAYDVVMTK